MAGIGTQQISRVAVDIGPGLFTGLRVGVATAKALAAALDIPIVGCSSLELLAHPHRRQDRTGGRGRRRQARRGLLGAVPAGAEGMTLAPITDAAVSGPDALVDELARTATEVLAVGEGARRYADSLAPVAGRRSWPAPRTTIPAAAVLLEVAATRPSVPLDEITPLYLRGADVRIGWEHAHRPADRMVAPHG